MKPEEGGRKSPLFTGYRGQFHYEGEDRNVYDGFQYFPDLGDDPVPSGVEVRSLIDFVQTSWEKFHAARMQIGTRFQIQEGARIVGQGEVTAVNTDKRPERL